MQSLLPKKNTFIGELSLFEASLLNIERKRVKNPDLDGINVVGDDDELSLLLLDEGGHSVDALADHGGALGRGVLLNCHICYFIYNVKIKYQFCKKKDHKSITDKRPDQKKTGDFVLFFPRISHRYSAKDVERNCCQGCQTISISVMILEQIAK